MAEDSLTVFSSFLNRLVWPDTFLFEKKRINLHIFYAIRSCADGFYHSHFQTGLLSGQERRVSEAIKEDVNRLGARGHAQRRYTRVTPPGWRFCVVVLLTTAGGIYESSSLAFSDHRSFFQKYHRFFAAISFLEKCAFSLLRKPLPPGKVYNMPPTVRLRFG